MVNPVKYMLENPELNLNRFDVLLKSRLFSYSKVAAGGLLVAGFAKKSFYREGSNLSLPKVGEWFKGILGKGSEKFRKMVNPLKYMLENPELNPNRFDVLLKSRLFRYCKVAAGGIVVAGFAKMAFYCEGVNLSLPNLEAGLRELVEKDQRKNKPCGKNKPCFSILDLVFYRFLFKVFGF